ncbi:MAG: hypothetical protein HUJ31_06335, partial [Pseudomonadales bacterium]|nr:hypothetical protein [Pseudomonadales bacterium]
MSRHLERDLDGLRKSILTLGSLVEGSTNKSILATNRLDDQIIDDMHD